MQLRPKTMECCAIAKSFKLCQCNDKMKVNIELARAHVEAIVPRYNRPYRSRAPSLVFSANAL